METIRVKLVHENYREIEVVGNISGGYRFFSDENRIYHESELCFD